MPREHQARITWSAAQVAHGLPANAQTIDPSWFAGDTPQPIDGWSLICRFESPPSDQGNPSAAHVCFYVPEAPHERLKPGISLRLFERATQAYATVDILD